MYIMRQIDGCIDRLMDIDKQARRGGSGGAPNSMALATPPALKISQELIYLHLYK